MLERGWLRARIARGNADRDAALRLRGLAFFGDPGHADGDGFDDACHHLLVEPIRGGAPLCTVRLLPSSAAESVATGYSAQAYDLAALAAYPGPVMELGRFCLHPDARDPHIVRLALAAVAAEVDARGVRLLFGCASFAGTDPAPHDAALALLGAAHGPPDRWAPRRRAAEVVTLSGRSPPRDRRAAVAGLPPLLRSYLGLGGWVSDHAVIDRDMGTLHVFTAVEIAAIPEARRRALRAIAT